MANESAAAAQTLLALGGAAQTAHELVYRAGRVFAYFGGNTQDSGNVSYGVEIDGVRLFVKTAGVPGAVVATPAHPAHELRVAQLHNAVEVARSIEHDALPALHGVMEAADGPMLVYEWLPGELLRGSNSHQPLERFRQLAWADTLPVLDAIFDVHLRLEQAGWVIEDFYDGCIIFDFERCDVHLVDLDHAHRGPFTNTVGRMFGSTRFMAPEEFERGRRIDGRTMAFVMGRTVSVLASDGSLDRKPFRGSENHFQVMRKACRHVPAERYPSVAAFVDAWGAAPRDAACGPEYQGDAKLVGGNVVTPDGDPTRGDGS